MASLPSQIGRYQIKSLIGRGGMGDLYLAHDPNTNRLVAIKLLNATLDSTELRERFAREARALAALNHPNIVNIYDTGEFESSPFIVMEYVRGETLAELIRRRAALSVSQKLGLMEELCAGSRVRGPRWCPDSIRRSTRSSCARGKRIRTNAIRMPRRSSVRWRNTGSASSPRGPPRRRRGRRRRRPRARVASRAKRARRR